MVNFNYCEGSQHIVVIWNDNTITVGQNGLKMKKLSCKKSCSYISIKTIVYKNIFLIIKKKK